MTTKPDRLNRETLGTGILDPRDWREFFDDHGRSSMIYTGDEDIANIVVWCLKPGQENSTHRHADAAHIIFVLEGEGVILRGDEGEPDPIKAGQLLIMPRHMIHGFRNTGTVNLSYVAASTGKYEREAIGAQAAHPVGGH